MDRLFLRCSASAALALMLAALLALPAVGNSPTVTGEATALQATALGSGGTASTTVVSDSGPLAGTNDARDASQTTASVPSMLTADTPAAATISWSDQVDSMASVNSLNFTQGGVVITANSVVTKVSSAGRNNITGIALIDGLAVNGTPVTVTGKSNQSVNIPGGQLIINETKIKKSTGTITLNALHIVMNGSADVVVASATAGIS